MKNTVAPTTSWVDPAGTADTVDHETWSRTSTTNTTVNTPVTTVITACNRMTTSKPRTPPPTTSAATTSRATTSVVVPPPHPSAPNTVEVAIVARMVSAVSQPTVRIQLTPAGSRFPRTPN